MPSSRALAAASLAVLVLGAISAVAAPGVLTDPGDEGPLNPGYVRVVESPISVGAVTGETADLTLHTTLRHRGNPTEDVSVRYRAIDADSGLLVASKTVRVGTVRGDGETAVNGTLTVAREGGYRLEATVFRNDTRVDQFSTRVSGLRALTPAYARSNVTFADADAVPAVSVAVESVDDNRTTLSVGTWLTSTGANDAEDLTVTVVLRQADSNLVAAKRTTSAGAIRAGRTQVVETSVTVPSDYNYYVDAVLLKDGVVIDTVRSTVNLDPKRTISANETERDVEFHVGDFEEGETPTPQPEGTPGGATGTQTLGFGPVVAVVALLLTALFARRTHD